MEEGTRVRWIGEDQHPGGIKKALPAHGQLGTIVGIADESYLTKANETPEQKAIRCKEFTKNNSRIKWDNGNTHGWDFPNNLIEKVEA